MPAPLYSARTQDVADKEQFVMRLLDRPRECDEMAIASDSTEVRPVIPVQEIIVARTELLENEASGVGREI